LQPVLGIAEILRCRQIAFEPEPQAKSATTPWSGSMMLTSVCTSEGGVKNSPLSYAPCMANFIKKYS
jgi:hypothetical protein